MQAAISRRAEEWASFARRFRSEFKMSMPRIKTRAAFAYIVRLHLLPWCELDKQNRGQLKLIPNGLVRQDGKAEHFDFETTFSI